MRFLTIGLLEVVAGGAMTLFSLGVICYIGYLYYRRETGRAREEEIDQIETEKSEQKSPEHTYNETEQPLLPINCSPKAHTGNQMPF